MDRNLLEKNNKKKANNQLSNIDCEKLRIKKEIYTLYDLYLKIIRSNLQNYLGEAIKVLLDTTIDGISVKEQKTLLFIKDDLKNLVNKILPFLTIEQLSIKNEYGIANQINDNSDFISNYNLKEEVYAKKIFEPIHGNNFINYCNYYYKNLNYKDNPRNINLDNFILENKYFDDYKKDESIGFINSTIYVKDFEEDKFTMNIYQSRDSKYFIPFEFKDILLWIDTIESSLNLYLQELSIEINNELLKKNILNIFVNNDLLFYIFENHLLFSNPSPFLLTFDPSLNLYINFDKISTNKNLSKINLININSAELEFININLNMLKNQVLNLKSNIYLLIKKENYWCNKLKLNSNIQSTINNL